MFREKRRHPRAPVLGVATVTWGDNAQATYLVGNVSAGGALLIGTRPIPIDTRVTVTLDLGKSRVSALVARVARLNVRADDACDLALAFEHATMQIGNELQAERLRALANRRAADPRCALIVDPADADRQLLESDLQALGLQTLAHATPINAVPYVSQPRSRIDIAFVDLSNECADGIDLLAFVARAHPGARRVVVASRLGDSHLESVRSFLGGCQVLRKPWSRDELARLLSE